MWRVAVPRSVQRSVDRFPLADAERIADVIAELARDPFAGDIRRLTAVQYRRRVGAYRIIYEVDVEHHTVDVKRAERRTSTTYRKR